MTQQMLLQGAMLGAGLSMKNNTQRNIILSALGVGVLYGFTLPFSRSHESEADQIGLLYMARAGYDPNEALQFWQRFSRVKDGKAPPEWASTHPADTTRMQEIRSYLSRAKYDYQNVKLKHGLGQKFSLPQPEPSPEKPQSVTGASVEDLTP